MGGMKRRKIVKPLLILITLGAAIIIFIAFGPPHLIEKTEAPEFCASCHVMIPQYEAWFHSGKHRNVECIECHLPNNNPVEHFIWKGIDGTKDLILFFTGNVPEKIHASEHAKRTIKANCIRCHEGMVALINTEDRDCWECHREVMHEKMRIY